MEPPARFKWIANQMLLLFILVSVAFLSFLTSMRLAIQGREVEIPKLIGMNAGDAQAVLASRQLGIRIADRAFSELPKDSVVRQSPPPGMKVKAGQRAHVVLIRGQQQGPIPALEQESLRAARIELLRGGLQVGEVSSLYLGADAAPEPNFVLQQFPPAAARNAGSPRVNLLVTLGPREAAYVMPDLAGLNISEAQRRLAAIGLKLEKTAPPPLALVPPGTVLAQKPAAGQRVTPGTGVELQVAGAQ